jgi:hypothetical protein
MVQYQADVFRLDLVDFTNYDVDFYTSIQETLKKIGEQFFTWSQAHWGVQMANFLSSDPGDIRMDHTWEPVRGLGKGGFGLVGLWERRGARAGTVEDSVAIKEMRAAPPDITPLRRNRYLAREAVIMQQLNDVERQDNYQYRDILRLRSFKYFPNSSKWRFYLEFAPYGDFFRLVYGYKAWQTHFPEEFLWHVFNSFARAAVKMQEGPFTDVETGKPTKWSVIHFDIKTDNIYMASPDKNELFSNYPSIKVADFGLADLVGEVDDDNNPYNLRERGTPEFRPPVSIFTNFTRYRSITDITHQEQTCFTAHWQQRPYGVQLNLGQGLAPTHYVEMEKAMRDPGYKFSSAHNVWGFGKVMHDMMTLEYPGKLDEQMNFTTTEHRYYHDYNQHAIPEMTTAKNPEYSSSLRELIRECVHIDMARRPTPKQLLARTQSGLADAASHASQEAGPLKGPRVYYMGNEINHMPLGDANQPMSRGAWRSVRDEVFTVPHWQPLLSARWASQVINRELVNQPIQEGGPQLPLRNPRFYRATVRPDRAEDNPTRVKWSVQTSGRGPERNKDGKDGGYGGGKEQPKPPELLEEQRRAQQEALNRLVEALVGFATPPARPSGGNGDESPAGEGHASPPPPPQRVKLNPPKPPPKSPLRPQPSPLSRQPSNSTTRPPPKSPLRPQPSPLSRQPTRSLPDLPPDPPAGHQPIPPPRQTQKRKRNMGLSAGRGVEEPEGHVVKGHNLKKRRR